MEPFETATFVHMMLRENVENCLSELAERVARRSEIEENANWAQVGDLRRLDDLLEQALEFFKDIDR